MWVLTHPHVGAIIPTLADVCIPVVFPGSPARITNYGVDMLKATFGGFIYQRRSELRLTLRAFCAKAGIDPSNYSKYERGVAVPTEQSVLRKIAKGLGIPVKAGSSEWIKLQSLASAARGEFPTDLLQNERILAALPAFYQRLRDEGLPKDQDEVEALVNILKGEM